MQQYPPHLSMLLHYLGILKIQSFCKYLADMEKLQTNCIFSAPILIPLHAQLCMLSVFMCYYHNLVVIAKCEADHYA